MSITDSGFGSVAAKSTVHQMRKASKASASFSLMKSSADIRAGYALYLAVRSN